MHTFFGALFMNQAKKVVFVLFVTMGFLFFTHTALAFTVGSSLEIDGGISGTHTDIVIEGDAVYMVYYNDSLKVLQYSECTSSCQTSSNQWSVTTIDSSQQVGQFPSLIRDSSGALHVTYYDEANTALKYATCSASCTTKANWTVTTIDGASTTVGQFSSLAKDSAGILYVVYYDSVNFDLKLASCSSSCTTASQWTAVLLEGTGVVGQYAELVIDSTNSLHVVYYNATVVGAKFELDYKTCASSCSSAASWSTASVARATVNTLETGGLYVDLMVDSSNVLHASYQFAGWDGTSYYYNLEYSECASSCSSGEWSHAVVDSGNVVTDGYSYSSLAKDSSGNLTALYYNTIAQQLKYKTCVSGATCTSDDGWTSAATIDSTAGVGQYVNVAATSSGLKAVYYDSTNVSPKYAQCSSSCSSENNWLSLVIHPSAAAGQGVQVAQDSTGRLHTVYYDSTNQTIRYSTCASNCSTTTSWVTHTPLTTTDDVGSYLDIAIDDNDYVYVAYYNATAQAVELAFCNANCSSSYWTTARLYQVSGEDLGKYVSIAQDANEQFHLVFYNTTQTALQYITCSSNCYWSSNWSIEATTIDGASTTVGEYASLDIQNSTLHVAYYDAANTQLFYATCSSGCTSSSEWSVATIIDTVGTVGKFASLDVNEDGLIAVAYYDDGSNSNLKYARCSASCTSASSWAALTVESTNSVGQYADAAIDPAGNMHIAYFDDTNNTPRYAYCSTNCTDSNLNWTISAINHKPFGQYTSFLIDEEGNTQLFYTTTNVSGSGENSMVGYTTILHDDDNDGYTESRGDCDDTSSSVNPDATETLDGIDNNCDGSIDESSVNFDDDGDGHCETAGSACTNGSANDDWDDTDATVYAGAPELADGIDNDQDGVIDDGMTNFDDDGDGYCDTAGSDCMNGTGNEDDDDENAAIYPGAPELVDGLDNDQDGFTDEGTVNYDDDGDGFCETVGSACVNGSANTDANDADSTVYAGAPELADGIDNDQDGTVDEGTVNYDRDADGYGNMASPYLGTDCNDFNNTIYPGAPEVEDSLDNNCDGTIDEGLSEDEPESENDTVEETPDDTTEPAPDEDNSDDIDEPVDNTDSGEEGQQQTENNTDNGNIYQVEEQLIQEWIFAKQKQQWQFIRKNIDGQAGDELILVGTNKKKHRLTVQLLQFDQTTQTLQSKAMRQLQWKPANVTVKIKIKKALVVLKNKHRVRRIHYRISNDAWKLK